MRSKYFKALFVVAFLPVLLLGGAYFYLQLNAPAAPKASAPPFGSAPQADLQAVQTKLQTVSSAFSNAVRKVNDDLTGLTTRNSDTDLVNFVNSHPGVTGLFQVSAAGKLEKMIPPSAGLADDHYGSSDEFKKLQEKLKVAGTSSQFYSRRLSYPSFTFALSTSNFSVVEVVFSLEKFFQDLSLQGNEVFLMALPSGTYLYHSNKAKLVEAFNPRQEPWLAKVLTDLSASKSGVSLGPSQAAVYNPSGINAIGIAQIVPYSSSASAGAAPAASSESPVDLLQSPMSLAVVLALVWIFLVGALSFKWVAGPLAKTQALLLGALKNNRPLTPDQLKGLGSDEIGQIAKAASSLLEGLQKERETVHHEKQEFLAQAKSGVEAAKTQAQTAQHELGEKNQLLADKLKELDAMKGMTEGLRNQSEQAKAENAKLKGQLASLEQGQGDFQKKLTEAQAKLKEMDVKLLQAATQSSPLQTSQVRVSAIKTMAEELKTTLGIIKGYVSSTLGATPGGISEKQQEFLGMVINRSARLEKFITDLVDVYQVELEQKDAKLEEVNLAQEIEALAFNFQAQADVKNIKLRVDTKPNLPKVPVIRRRLNQIWNILYLQAIKDAPRASTIVISVEPVGDNVVATLQDPGLAVTPESLPKLFDEFYDPKHPASPQLAGTGLKLALVKTILSAHGGGVTAEKADPGTKIILSFPTKIKKPGAAPAIAPPPMSPAPAIPVIKPPSLTPPGMGMPKPATPSGGVVPPSPALSPSASAKGEIPPKPAAPPLGIPPVPGPSTPPKPAAPGLLDALLDKKLAPPPGAPPAPALGLDALKNVPSVTAPGLRPSPVPGAPMPGGPPTPAPKTPAPPMPSAPPAPASPKVVPTSLKPTTPPPGILDLDSLDSFKVDPMAPKPPAPPPLQSPKPPTPPPPPSPGKPFLKDLDKDGSQGDLIE